jgi:hypothetical protein
MKHRCWNIWGGVFAFVKMESSKLNNYFGREELAILRLHLLDHLTTNKNEF